MNAEEFSAQSVTGYLRNASRRLRVPGDEGGRGTRRRTELITSAVVQGPILVTDDGDEWDVVFDGAAVDTKACEDHRDEQKDNLNRCLENGRLPNVDGGALKGELVDVAAMQPVSKTEVIDLDYAAPTPSPCVPRGDPTFQEMRDERDAAIAMRKSEKLVTLTTKVVEMIAVVQRGRQLCRQAFHPQFRDCLLRIRGRDGGSPRLPVITAVREAKDILHAARGQLAPSLAPCWVTCKVDGARNATGQAITVLLRCMQSLFHLSCATVDKNDAESSVLFHPLETLTKGLLTELLRQHCRLRTKTGSKRERDALVVTNSHIGRVGEAGEGKICVTSPMYFCLMMMSLCRIVGLSPRLVIAFDLLDPVSLPKAAMHIDMGAPITGSTDLKESVGKKPESEKPPAKTKLPQSYCWIEVWCPQRLSYISVNPCSGCTTLWGASYAFSFTGDGVVDSTPRYTSKCSTIFARRLDRENLGVWNLWPALPREERRSISEIVLDGSHPTTAASIEKGRREAVQLDKLLYAEALPNTLSALKKHPLYVIEQDLGRWESIYPRDRSTIVGNVKGHIVFKRTAVVSLRSRDGWLRLGRSLLSPDEVAFKVVPPPPSRPFSPPSHFFGEWQTCPFCPIPLRPDGSIVRHGNSSWYILLQGSTPPAGITHLTQPDISKVARKMNIDFALAVTGFRRRTNDDGSYIVNRGGKWQAVIHGIVLHSDRASDVISAYKEWIELAAEEQRQKKRKRALGWWSLLIQRRLAMDRLTKMFDDGERLKSKGVKKPMVDA